MKPMNIWDLRDELGLTHYQVRTLVDAVNRGDPDYAWMNDVLVREGVKKPKVRPELFVEAYRNFRIRAVNGEIERLRDQLRAFARRQAG